MEEPERALGNPFGVSALRFGPAPKTSVMIRRNPAETVQGLGFWGSEFKVLGCGVYL